MVKPKVRRTRNWGLFAAVMVAGVSMPMFVNAESTSDVFDRISVLEQQTQDLSRSLLNFQGFNGAPIPSVDVGEDVMVVAQSRDIANANLRLQQLEEQMRVLTGQLDGLQFQMTQVYAQLERMNEDNDFRFQQLESGASGKTDAVTQSGSATLSGELPQNQVLTTNPSTVTLNGGDDAIDLNGSFASQDPLVGNVDGDGSLPLGGQPLVLDLSSGSAVTFNGATSGLTGSGLSGLGLSGDGLSGAGQALALDFDPGQLVTSNDADAQYQAGFDAVMQGDYDFAIAQFEQFVSLFPAHDLAPDANNWLGESLIQKGAYEDAAEILFAGFQRYETSTRAPDLLLKLGVALKGAGERDTACRTFGEVVKRYPNMGSAFADRVTSEMAQAQC